MEGLMKRNKTQLIDHIKNLEIEIERLTRERNAAISALDRWKTIQCLKSEDSIDKMTIDCVKQLMKIVDKVRTQL